MGWITTIILGGVTGWLASIVMKTNAQMGIIANILVGVVGSSLGFWLLGLVGLAATGTLMRVAVAIGGACVLIYLLKVIGLFK